MADGADTPSFFCGFIGRLFFVSRGCSLAGGFLCVAPSFGFDGAMAGRREPSELVGRGLVCGLAGSVASDLGGGRGFRVGAPYKEPGGGVGAILTVCQTGNAPSCCKREAIVEMGRRCADCWLFTRASRDVAQSAFFDFFASLGCFLELEAATAPPTCASPSPPFFFVDDSSTAASGRTCSSFSAATSPSYEFALGERAPIGSVEVSFASSATTASRLAF